MINGEDIRAGMLIGGRRVAAMTRGVGQTTVRFAEERRNRRGNIRSKLSDPVTYLHGRPVPGTKPPTTWAMPAGPVHLTPGREQRQGGTRQMGGWWGDSDATDRGSRADRHQRRIESIVYA
jgi:hypothetical protein